MKFILTTDMKHQIWAFYKLLGGMNQAEQF